jgi:hypothetical protein
MDLSYKDATRFLVPGESPVVVEVTVSPVGGQAWVPLGRRFRVGAKGEALGKMIRWVRGRFPEAIPIAERRASGA